MQGPSLVAARERLALTPDALAADLGLPPHAYAACEQGRTALPRRAAQTVAYRVAMADVDDALEASGLPACGWVAGWEGRAPAADAKLDVQVRHAEQLVAHGERCGTCQARQRFIQQRFPDLPAPPQSAAARALGRVVTWVDARPAWARPACYGALFLAALTGLRAVVLLVARPGDARAAGLALGTVVFAAAAGACGGLVYALLGRPLRRVPVAGPYLAGVVAVWGYTFAAAAGLWCMPGHAGLTFDGGGDVALLAGYTAVLGLVLGRQWFRTPT